jgi:hypothetical protein
VKIAPLIGIWKLVGKLFGKINFQKVKSLNEKLLLTIAIADMSLPAFAQSIVEIPGWERLGKTWAAKRLERSS